MQPALSVGDSKRALVVASHALPESAVHSPVTHAPPRSNVDATPQLGAALQGLLGRVLALGTVRRSPADLLLFLEVSTA